MNVLKMKELKKKIKDQKKKIKLEQKEKKELASKARFQIFKPIGSAAGELLDATVNGFILSLSPNTYIMDSSSQMDGKGHVVDDNDEDDDDDDEGDANEKDKRDPCSADTTQAIVLKSALLAGLGTAASSGSASAAVLSGLGNLLSGASSASNQIAQFKDNAKK
jgi:hypothetical protein